MLYFVLNTLLITAVPYPKRKEWPTARDLFGSFGWVGITFAGSASISCLLFLNFRQAGIGVLIAAAPIIAMLLSTLHYFFRQREADESVRRTHLETIEREVEVAACHVRALELSERRFHSAFTHASIGMALVAFDARVLQVNAALRRLLGLDDSWAANGQRFGDFVDAADGAVLDERLQQLHTNQLASFEVDLRLRHLDGDAVEVWATLNGSLFTESDAAAPCLILQVQDISARRQAETRLHHIAFHDSLTGLPNRRRFVEHLEQAFERLRADPQRRFGLMFIDFDRFKLINDSLGHAVGDEFLVQVAQRMQRHLRPNDVIGRLGGDEFAILAAGLDCDRYATGFAARPMDVLSQPLHIEGTELRASASIGITCSTMGYTAPPDMLRDADTAMYKAKANGRGCYAVFNSALHTEVADRLRLEGELRRSLAAGQLAVAYQPIFDLVSGDAIGLEALARWDHPELGAISPATFIAVAEDAGLIRPLTDFVLRSACRQLRLWQLRDGGFAELVVHVNVSGSDIAHPDFVARIHAALADARLQPRHLTLELTENILMERLEAALPVLHELRRLGVGLSVDDFGTGYSSLQHLSSPPVDSLKIDRAFVAVLQRGSREASVVRAIVMLGESLGKTIVVEGIETEAQAEQLRQMGCLTGQGYHLSRPLPPAAIDRLLDDLAARPRTVPGVAWFATTSAQLHGPWTAAGAA